MITVTDSPDSADVLALEDWLEGGFGLEVLRAERAMAASKLPGLFGFHLMQLGISRRVRLYDDSAVRHRFQIGRFLSPRPWRSVWS